MKTIIFTILTLTSISSFACCIQIGVSRHHAEEMLEQKDADFVPGSLRINDQHTRFQVGSVLRTGLARFFTRQDDCNLDGSTRQITYANISYQRMNGDMCLANIVVRQGVNKDRLKFRRLNCESVAQNLE